MREYQNRANTSIDRVFTIQYELEFYVEKVKTMKEQFEEWQDHIGSFDVQLNTKIDELDIEREELQRAKNQNQ